MSGWPASRFFEFFPRWFASRSAGKGRALPVPQPIEAARWVAKHLRDADGNRLWDLENLLVYCQHEMIARSAESYDAKGLLLESECKDKDREHLWRKQRDAWMKNCRERYPDH